MDNCDKLLMIAVIDEINRIDKKLAFDVMRADVSEMYMEKKIVLCNELARIKKRNSLDGEIGHTKERNSLDGEQISDSLVFNKNFPFPEKTLVLKRQTN